MGYSTVDDFLVDEKFRNWVLAPTPELDYFWQTWLENNPDQSHVLGQAKAVVLNVKYDRHDAPEGAKGKVYQKILAAEKEKKHRHLATRKINERPWWKRPGSYAATLLILLAFAALTLNQFLPEEQVESSEVLLLERNVPFGEKLNIMLADGSSVKLNSGTVFRFPESFDSTREVYLEGEAFFEVAHDPQRPFIIHTGGFSTEVLGTSFNVNYQRNKRDTLVQVAVVTGKVKVSQDLVGSQVFLLPDEMATYESGSLTTSTFDPNQTLGWKDRILSFENADLEEIADKLEKWYGCQVNISGELDIKQQRKFSGIFRNKSLKEVVEGISYTSKFKYSIEGNMVKIF